MTVVSARDVAVATEVTLIVAGVWVARFARRVLNELRSRLGDAYWTGAARTAPDQQVTIQPSSGSSSPGKP